MDRASTEGKSRPTAKKQWLAECSKELTRVIGFAIPDEDRSVNHAETIWLAAYLRGLYYLHSPARVRVAVRAMYDFRRCLKIQPKIPNTVGAPLPYFVLPYIALGDAYVKNNDLKKAREIWRVGMQRFPQDPQLERRVSMTDRQLVVFVEKARSDDKPLRADLSILWERDLPDLPD